MALLPTAIEHGRGLIGDQLKALTSGDGKLREAWKTISESDEFRGFLTTGMSLVSGAVAQGRSMVAERLGVRAARVELERNVLFPTRAAPGVP